MQQHQTVGDHQAEEAQHFFLPSKENILVVFLEETQEFVRPLSFGAGRRGHQSLGVYLVLIFLFSKMMNGRIKQMIKTNQAREFQGGVMVRSIT